MSAITAALTSSASCTAAATELHIPVLAAEVVSALQPRDGGLYIDGTFGAGGYSRLLLQSADCHVLGIDRDPAALARGEKLAAAFPGRLHLREGCFGQMAALAQSVLESVFGSGGTRAVDGVALDLGVSSPQLDEGARGFSFRLDGPLDMRMSASGETAADLLARLPEAELADLIYAYGEERHSRRVARAIVTARALTPITRTLQLAELIRGAVPRANDGIDPATRTFQALRIAVNDELGELERALRAAEQLLQPGGRIAIVSFHSLEDRAVKRHFVGEGGSSRHVPVAATTTLRPLRPLARKPILPGAAELAANPRSRSARLRVAERLAVPS